MTGIQEIFELTGTKGMRARVMVQESYDPLANSSDIQVGVEVASDTYAGHIYYLTGVVAAGGQTLQVMDAYIGSHYVYMQDTGTYYPVAAGDESYTGSPWTLGGIAHEIDGSKTVTISLNLTGDEEHGRGADGWTLTGSREVTLTHIPRASTLAATDAVVGAVSMVAVSRKSADYSHSIHYRFGVLQGYLTPEGLTDRERVFTDTSVAFFLPDSFYYQIPNAKSGSCILTCRTYRDGIQVGEAQSCTFTVHTGAAACAPLVSGTVVDGNPDTAALTGNREVLVRYMSNAVCTISAQSRNGASLTEKTVDSVAVTANTYTVSCIERNVVVFAARDSRGYTGSVKVQSQMVPYVRLSCNPSAKRTDPTSGNAVLEVTGDCYTGSFGAADNTLQLHYRIGSGAWQAVTPQLGENGYSAQVQLSGLDYTKSHTLEVRAVDRLQSVTKAVKVGKGIPVFDWGENDFAFHVPVRLAGMPEGDSDAVCKAYADGKLSVVTLWENPDPSVEFPAQTVEMDLGDCAFLFCTAIAKTGAAEYQISSIVRNVPGNAGHINSFHADNKDFWLNWRRFTVRYNGIQFDKAWMRDMANNTVYEDWRARSVPVAVYGLRGMQT